MIWLRSHKFDRAALPLADRHYNRRAVGSPQFVPPGRAVVLLSSCRRALWVTSWPFAAYVRHAWPGAWVNSLFRNEGAGLASELIREAIAATRTVWPDPPSEGLVSFVDPRKVPGVPVHGRRVYGYCYQRAGFHHVGETARGLWAWHLAPADMPDAAPPLPGTQYPLAVCA